MGHDSSTRVNKITKELESSKDNQLGNSARNINKDTFSQRSISEEPELHNRQQDQGQLSADLSNKIEEVKEQPEKQTAHKFSLSEEAKEETQDVVPPLESIFKSKTSPLYKHLLVSHKDSFKEIGPLGKGGFGSVVKAQHILDSNIYAIKTIKLYMGVDQDIKDHKVFREVQIMTIVNNINVSPFSQSLGDPVLHLLARTYRQNPSKGQESKEESQIAAR